MPAAAVDPRLFNDLDQDLARHAHRSGAYGICRRTRIVAPRSLLKTSTALLGSTPPLEPTAEGVNRVPSDRYALRNTVRMDVSENGQICSRSQGMFLNRPH
jgi:hypothetical protein